MAPERKILVPVDESSASITTLKYVLQHLVRDGDSLHVVHILPRSKIVVLGMSLLTDEIPPVIDEATEDRSETAKQSDAKAQAYLNSTIVPLLQDGKTPFHTEVLPFDTSAESVGAMLCGLAEKTGASIMAMAKHNKGAVQEFFLGSATNHCTRHCKIPLLVLHAD